MRMICREQTGNWYLVASLAHTERSDSEYDYGVGGGGGGLSGKSNFQCSRCHLIKQYIYVYITGICAAFATLYAWAAIYIYIVHSLYHYVLSKF